MASTAAASVVANASSSSNNGNNSSKKEGTFGGWLQRVRRTGEYSDVVVRIKESPDFHLHMLPLLNESTYFRDLSSGSSSDSPQSSSSSSCSRPSVVEINDLPGGSDAFALAADFCYLLKPTFTFSNVGRVRAVAEFLGMPDLLDSTKKFLYNNVFGHWRSCVTFLCGYERVYDAVDDYIESRCLKVITAACTKAFLDTKHVSVPIPIARSSVAKSDAVKAAAVAAAAAAAAAGGNTVCWQSPCYSLTDVLVTVSALPDMYISQVVDQIVDAEVNLNLKCRQGRNVHAWVNHLLKDECSSNRSRRWVVYCLARMLLKVAPQERPWMELSSQYWCSLLEHVGHHVNLLEKEQQMPGGHLQNSGHHDMKVRPETNMLERLWPIKSFLEQRIGASLHELDDYLQSYNFSASTLLSLTQHFVREWHREDGEKELEEVAVEVDGCLWAFASEDPCSISSQHFIAIFSAFPASSRQSHDMLYAAIDKMLSKSNNPFSTEEAQDMWKLVDCDKLSPTVYEESINNPSFLCQPHVLERVLRRHNEELANLADEDRQHMRNIMQKVIKASLKLLEENSRRSKEIIQLQQQYSALLDGKMCLLRDSSSSCENSPDVYPKQRHIAPATPQQQRQQQQHQQVILLKAHDEDEEEDRMQGMVAPQTPVRHCLHNNSINVGGGIMAT